MSPPPLLSERATPYAIPSWSKEALVGAESITPADLLKQPADDRPACDAWTLSAGPRATADGTLCAWGGSASLTPVRTLVDAPPGVPAPLAAVLVELECGKGSGALPIQPTLSSHSSQPFVAHHPLSSYPNPAAIPSPSAIPVAARTAILARGLDSTFFVYDLGALHRCWNGWAAAFGPRITPHFAVKANPDPGLLRALAALGAGFDCASRAEISLVQGLGVHPDRIIYAHPCKPPAELRFACARGVALTTFDTGGEVVKLARWHPGARALLRIRADDPTARFCLGSKYGCEIGDAPALLAAAKAAGVAVVGVAFHVGSGARDPAAYGRAVVVSAAVFEAGKAAGHAMSILDLGGGFAGGDPYLADAGLGAIAAAVRAALGTHFSADMRVIAEPGRFFAEPVGTLAVAINGVRPHPAIKPLPPPSTSATRDAVDYFLSDGVYGSLNSIIYDDARLAFLPLRMVKEGDDGGGGGDATATTTPSRSSVLFPSTLYGPTCDSADIVARGVALPRLGVSDFLLSPRAAAYSIAGASNFNGFQATKARVAYVYSAAAGEE